LVEPSAQAGLVQPGRPTADGGLFDQLVAGGYGSDLGDRLKSAEPRRSARVAAPVGSEPASLGWADVAGEAGSAPAYESVNASEWPRGGPAPAAWHRPADPWEAADPSSWSSEPTGPVASSAVTPVPSALFLPPANSRPVRWWRSAASRHPALAGLSPGRRGVVALAVVGAVVALIAAYLSWRSEPRTVVLSARTDAAGGVVSTVPSDTHPSTSGSTIVVAVSGRVRHAGLVSLPAGARVADAVAAAGGVLPGTDTSFVNLAARVADGELIVIGATPPPGTTLGPTGATASGATSRIVDINTGTTADLDTLPGIGPALAQRIIDYRTAHGAFRRTDELRNVPGIGDAKYAAIKDLVTV
jgi:competence protein ComEA